MADDVTRMREALAQIARIAEDVLNRSASEEEQREEVRAEVTDNASRSGQLIQVFYDEKDACSKNNVVSIPGRDGRVEVRAGETTSVELESLVASFYWRCGDTEEKFKYDNCPPFNCHLWEEIRNHFRTLLFDSMAELLRALVRGIAPQKPVFENSS